MRILVINPSNREGKDHNYIDLKGSLNADDKNFAGCHILLSADGELLKSRGSGGSSECWVSSKRKQSGVEKERGVGRDRGYRITHPRNQACFPGGRPRQRRNWSNRPLNPPRSVRRAAPKLWCGESHGRIR